MRVYEDFSNSAHRHSDRFCFAINPFYKNAIIELAQEKNVSVGSILREAVWNLIEKEKSRKNAKRRYDDMKVAVSKGTHTYHEWKSLLKEFDGKCAKCGSSENITKDHIKPIYMGGDNSIENIQPLCLSCNVSNTAQAINWKEIRRKEREW